MEGRGEGLRFLADNMLGRLTRFMRIMGYDTTYPNLDEDDIFLINLSREEERILLTRDKLLSIRHKNSYLITSDRINEQIIQIVESFPPDRNKLFTRCTLCNGILVEGKYPCREEYHKAKIKNIKHCLSCGKCYWRGTHSENVIGYLENLGIYNES